MQHIRTALSDASALSRPELAMHVINILISGPNLTSTSSSRRRRLALEPSGSVMSDIADTFLARYGIHCGCDHSRNVQDQHQSLLVS